MKRLSIEAASQRQQRILDILICPSCRRGPFEVVGTALACPQCGFRGERAESSIRMLFATREPDEDDFLVRAKESVKRRFPGAYPALIELLSPVFAPRLLGRVLQQAPPDSHLVLDLGSGTGRHHPAIINVDLAPYTEVDLVCRIERLPFPDESVDAVVSVAVLEHVPNPTQVVEEMLRVLKPGGRVYCYVPFMQGIHASPDDYQRYTPHGLDVLFGAFAERRVSVAAGPTSGFLWLFQEWAAMLLSLGSRRLYWMWYALLLVVVAPLKYLDALLARHPQAANAASAFAIEARKG